MSPLPSNFKNQNATSIKKLQKLCMNIADKQVGLKPTLLGRGVCRALND